MAVKKNAVKKPAVAAPVATKTRGTRAEKSHIAVVTGADGEVKYVSPVHPNAAAATADMQMNAEAGDTVHLFKHAKSGTLKTSVKIA